MPTFLDSRASTFQPPARPVSVLSGANSPARGTPILSSSPAYPGMAKKKFKDLDDFLNESSESEAETESEEEVQAQSAVTPRAGVSQYEADSDSEDSTDEESDEDAALVSRNRA